MDEYPRSIAIISTSLPRRCGIATFATDLFDSLNENLNNKPEKDENNKKAHLIMLAMDNLKENLVYPEKVKFIIRDMIPADYNSAADYLNTNKIDICIIQHEFGIFGGIEGINVLDLLRNLKIPVITTLHTVFPSPTKLQKMILSEIGILSDQVVVMTNIAKDLLLRVYKISEEKITIIPHGIHDIPFVDTILYKDQLNLGKKKVVLTFGLLGPSKGIEMMIEALRIIVKENKDLVYVILGATHPEVKRHSGEQYRESLHRQIKEFELDDYVIFIDQFVDLETLKMYLSAADIYVSPYSGKDQIVSGTLAYATGAGKAVVSTPYLYAQELLDDGRGILVPFGNSEILAEKIIQLLLSDDVRNDFRKKAYIYCRSMIWKEVGNKYLDLSRKCLQHQREEAIQYINRIKISIRKLDALPEINFNHLRMMTDGAGILQHSYYSIPNRIHGYSLDDNARALIATTMYYALKKDDTILPLINTYISFIVDAYNHEKGRFRNFMSYDRKWIESIGSEDSHARALWAIGSTIKIIPDQSIKRGLNRFFINIISNAESLEFPHAWAYTLLGLHYYLNVYSGDTKAQFIRQLLVKKLYELFKNNISENWLWFKDILTYSNAVLPHALLITAADISDAEMLEFALRCLDWLLDIQTGEKGQLSIIGNKGWFKKDGKRANYDQQPIEAQELVQACVDAFRITNDWIWLEKSCKCFNWFLGENDLNIPMYDPKMGGVYDGLESGGINENMGAESCLAGLIANITMHTLYEQELSNKKIKEVL